jgi:hypothetical protein
MGFKYDGIEEAIHGLQRLKRFAVILPMYCDDKIHNCVVERILTFTSKSFLHRVNTTHSDIKKSANEFFDECLTAIEHFWYIMKHPKFSNEKECRIITKIQDGEQKWLQFRQRRTLLARHLPIKITRLGDGVDRLPLRCIYVGPGPSQDVSRISVVELLKKYGYQNVKVEVSKVPYRVP